MVRKRKVKRVLLLGLVMVFISNSVVLNVSAKSNVIDKEEIKEYFLSIGTEQSFLDMTNDEKLEQLYFELRSRGEATFTGYETKVVEVQGSNENSRGQISTDKLKLTIAIFEHTANGKIFGLSISLGYQWLTQPWNNFTDAHTFSFDGSKFMISGMYAESGFMTTNGYKQRDFVDGPALAMDGGLGWYLKTNVALEWSPIKPNFGGASIYLLPRNGATSKANLRSSMYYNYGHARVAFGVSISKNGPSITLSGPAFDNQTVVKNY
ncbi:MAG: hypothetical protein FWE25_07235 [Lachnospiraceae bacterium]|nr:hypothetical protein [Lachnospiraceae bacterium]